MIPISINKKNKYHKGNTDTLLDANKETNQKVKGEKMKCGIFLRHVTTTQSIKSIKIT
jgi:hypothetical protein